MSRVKYAYEVRNWYPNKAVKDEEPLTFTTLEVAAINCIFKHQCTFEESQTNSRGYSHIIVYKDDEVYDNLYFI